MSFFVGLAGLISGFALSDFPNGLRFGGAPFLQHNVQDLTQSPGRFLRYDEVQEIIASYYNSGPEAADSRVPSTEALRDASAWDDWIRARDREIRSRIDRGVEDSISNLVLYGTSYTRLPRVESVEEATTPEGELAKTTRERVHALALAVGGGDSSGGGSKHPSGSLHDRRPAKGKGAPPVSVEANERLEFAREFLNRRRVRAKDIEPYLAANLLRFVREQREYQDRLQAASRSGDPGTVLFTRGTLFEKRGLSVDTSLLPNFALEKTLQALKEKGALPPGSIRRIAVVGPGLDFTDKREGYDFYPLQTLQPFAVFEAVVRLGLGRADTLSMAALELNPFVNAHIERLAKQARAGHAYVIQLPRDTQADWNEQAIAYWDHFGDVLGTRIPALPVPTTLAGVRLRAVVIRPRYAARVESRNLDIVAETLDGPPGKGFDLVIATNILVYYSRFEQSLAMTSISQFMNPGGIFLANNVLPAQHPRALEYLGRRSISYSSSGAYGDDVVVYRRR